MQSPDKKLSYPIPHDEGGGSIWIFSSASIGRQAGNPAIIKNNNNSNNNNTPTKTTHHVILCCPGFPDDQESFVPLASQLVARQKREGACILLVGIICIVGYDNHRTTARHRPKEGYSLDEMIRGFREGAKVLLHEAATTLSLQRDDFQFTLILHDMGVPTGMSFVNQAMQEEVEEGAADQSKSSSSLRRQGRYLTPDRVVLMDVGLAFHPRDKDKPPIRGVFWHDHTTPLRTVLSELYYRSTLAVTFFLYCYVSSWLAVAACSSFYLVGMVTTVGPCRWVDHRVIFQRLANGSLGFFHLAYMAYPYYPLGLQVLLLRYGTSRGDTSSLFPHATLPVLDQIPVLFLYGPNKNIVFHEDAMIEYLHNHHSSIAGVTSRAVAVQGGGHWFHLQYPNVVWKEVSKFLGLLD